MQEIVRLSFERLLNSVRSVPDSGSFSIQEAPRFRKLRDSGKFEAARFRK